LRLAPWRIETCGGGTDFFEKKGLRFLRVWVSPFAMFDLLAPVFAAADAAGAAVALAPSLLDWSRAQFALTAMFHWCFVPLTLGLGVIMAVVETLYVRSGDVKWRRAARFWQ
jgi:ABC-type nitrate/sulfonate/bicarbonate transport system substrate-binding protein